MDRYASKEGKKKKKKKRKWTDTLFKQWVGRWLQWPLSGKPNLIGSIYKNEQKIKWIGPCYRVLGQLIGISRRDNYEIDR